MAFETTADEALQGFDLTGKTAVITGVSAGLGIETARALQAAGARVIGAARDLDKAEVALAGLDVELVQADLADLDSVRRGAQQVCERIQVIDLLINNAGVMACPLQRTAQDFELQLGTNHLGHFVWTNALLGELHEGSRIVNLSSRGHLLSGIRWDDPHFRDESTYSKWTAYGQSKSANILFSVGLETRLGDAGIHAFAVHPGVIVTELGRHLSAEDVAALGARPGLVRKSIPQGAATTVWAATSPSLDGLGGIYLEDCEISEPTTGDMNRGFAAHAVDPDEAERLWEWSLAQTS